MAAARPVRFDYHTSDAQAALDQTMFASHLFLKVGPRY